MCVSALFSPPSALNLHKLLMSSIILVHVSADSHIPLDVTDITSLSWKDSVNILRVFPSLSLDLENIRVSGAKEDYTFNSESGIWCGHNQWPHVSWLLGFLLKLRESKWAQWELHRLHVTGGSNTLSFRSSQTSQVWTGLCEHWTLPKARAVGNRQSHLPLQQPARCTQRPVLERGCLLITSKLRMLWQWVVKPPWKS